MPNTPTVRDDPDRQRYEVLLDDVVVGFAEHRPVRPGVELFPHTVVTPEHEGKGFASAMVRYALDDVRARGVTVEATCWYVAGWIDRHPEYRDLLAAPSG